MTDGLVAALARAQAKFGPIVKGHENPHFKSKYADIADVLTGVRPVLAAEGIAVVQPLEWGEAGTFLVTRLMLGEETIISRLLLPIEGLTAQAFGSWLTYARRYCLCSLLGVHPEGDDDDGNAAQTAPARPQQARIVTGVQDRVSSGPELLPRSRDLSPDSAHIPVQLDPYALAAANPPEKPIAAMTMAELIAYGRTIGVVMSGSKADFVRTLEPYVLAATGEEPWDMGEVRPRQIEIVDGAAIDRGPAPKPESSEIAFEPVVAKPSAERLLPPDARKSVRSQ